MQKITFEDTTVTKQPYVTINDIEYEVTDGTYSGGTDLNANTFNTMQDNIEEAIDENKNVQLIAISDTAPTTFTTGDKYYNTSTNKVYTALNNSTWNNGETPLSDIFYILFSEQSSYSYDGNTLVSVGGGTEDIIISEEEPTSDDWKLWINNGEISSQASEIHIGKNAPTNSMQRTWFKIGKNLFDKNNRNVVNLYPSSTGTLQNNSYKSLLIEIEPNTTYTFTSLNAYSDGISLGTYTSIPTTSVTPTNRVGVTATENHGTITSGASDRFLLAYVKWSSSALTENELNGIMLEKGSTQSPYQPYVTPTINVDGEEIYNKNRLDNAFIEQPYNQQDFNNYTIPGSYMINNTSLTNIPVSAPGVLMVWVGNYSTPGTKYIAQLYISNQGAHSRFRDTGATQWSAWKQLHN